MWKGTCVSRARARCFVWTPQGRLTRVAGLAATGYSRDGEPATGASGESHLTGMMTTVIGTGRYGHSGDGGPVSSAQIGAPWGLTFDSQGNLYISDVTTGGMSSQMQRTTASYRPRAS